MMRAMEMSGTTARSGSGSGTCSTSSWSRVSRSSGMRWRDWISVASSVSVVVRAPLARAMKDRILAALTPSSAPWSMTLTTDSGWTRVSDTCRPPVPQPRAIGISRLA